MKSLQPSILTIVLSTAILSMVMTSCQNETTSTLAEMDEYGPQFYNEVCSGMHKQSQKPILIELAPGPFLEG